MHFQPPRAQIHVLAMLIKVHPNAWIGFGQIQQRAVQSTPRHGIHRLIIAPVRLIGESALLIMHYAPVHGYSYLPHLLADAYSF
jgi:hypothetical protein